MSTQLLDTSSKHPFSLIGLADTTWNALTEAAIRATWGPLAGVAKSVVLGLMQKITVGHLRVFTDTHTHDFPEHHGDEFEDEVVKAEMRVLKDTFWIRLCLMGDLGFAEAYMYGEVECEDLVSLFKVFLLNKDQLQPLDSRLSYLFSLPQKLTSYRFLNTLSNSRSNISAHYDISNEMFSGFLSQDMTYSCAIFADLEGDLKFQDRCHKILEQNPPALHLTRPLQLPSPPREASDTDFDSSTHTNGPSPQEATKLDFETHLNSNVSERLMAKLKMTTDDQVRLSQQPPTIPKNVGASEEQDEVGDLLDDELYVAQLRKLDHIIEKLKIPEDRPVRVLEIGSGWGSMAMRIARRYPLVTVDTLTLSIQQQELAKERIALQGDDVSKRIGVHLMDYRAMPQEWEASFDRVISVEMIEAVGQEFLEVYWKAIDWAMKPEKAVGVVQVITLPEARFEKYLNEIDFIRKWVLFPGGLLPTVTLLLQTLQDGSRGRLVVDSISNIGPHYARTLREWRRRFLGKFDSVIMPALKKEYPMVMGDGRLDQEKALEEIEVFKRKWIYYYCYCEVGFTTRTLGDHIITFVREGYEDYACNVFR